MISPPREEPFGRISGSPDLYHVGMRSTFARSQLLESSQLRLWEDFGQSGSFRAGYSVIDVAQFLVIESHVIPIPKL